MRLYFVRHGKSEANARHIISNGESLFHLTPAGREQAMVLAARLQTISFGTVFCSPILRARETADILCAALNLRYQVTEALREYDCGVLEERSDEESWRQHRYFFNEWMCRRSLDHRPEGGESFIDIRQRFVPFIETLQVRGEENLLLVGHGGLFQLMLPAILMNISNEFAREHGIGHTECIIAESNPDGFVCRQWGDSVPA